MGRRWLEQPHHGRRDPPPDQAGEVRLLPSASDDDLVTFPRSGMVLSQYYVQQVVMQKSSKAH